MMFFVLIDHIMSGIFSSSVILSNASFTQFTPILPKLFHTSTGKLSGPIALHFHVFGLDQISTDPNTNISFTNWLVSDLSRGEIVTGTKQPHRMENNGYWLAVASLYTKCCSPFRCFQIMQSFCRMNRVLARSCKSSSNVLHILSSSNPFNRDLSERVIPE